MVALVICCDHLLLLAPTLITSLPVLFLLLLTSTAEGGVYPTHVSKSTSWAEGALRASPFLHVTIARGLVEAEGDTSGTSSPACWVVKDI